MSDSDDDLEDGPVIKPNKSESPTPLPTESKTPPPKEPPKQLQKIDIIREKFYEITDKILEPYRILISEPLLYPHSGIVILNPKDTSDLSRIKIDIDREKHWARIFLEWTSLPEEKINVESADSCISIIEWALGGGTKHSIEHVPSQPVRVERKPSVSSRRPPGAYGRVMANFNLSTLTLLDRLVDAIQLQV
jgi:hypothetical protein